jgi:hypothetical protein
MPAPEEELLDARDVAKRLKITVPTLRAMARRGEYPELLHVTRLRYLVRKADHEAWMEGRWTSAEVAREELKAERMRAAALGVKI